MARQIWQCLVLSLDGTDSSSGKTVLACKIVSIFMALSSDGE